MNGSHRFEIISALGKGGFGTVYRARYIGQGGFEKQVALKVLNKDVAGIEEIASRLRDEARVLGLIRHRAIVQVDRLAHLGGGWVVVMEYVEGADLAQLVQAGLRVPIRSMLEIVAEVASALHVAYTSAGPDGRPLALLHRDIKPSNIQITSAGEVKVLDFGIARADFDNREAHTRSLAFGSVDYMAPERLDLLDGPAADIYALGAVMVEALSGRQLGRTSAVEHRHRPRIQQSLSRLAEDLPEESEPLLELLARMLEYDPDKRIPARELVRQALRLASKAAGEPLGFWAEEAVPLAMAARRPVDSAELTGSMWFEIAGPNTSAEEITGGALPSERAALQADASAVAEGKEAALAGTRWKRQEAPLPRSDGARPVLASALFAAETVLPETDFATGEELDLMLEPPRPAAAQPELWLDGAWLSEAAEGEDGPLSPPQSAATWGRVLLAVGIGLGVLLLTTGTLALGGIAAGAFWHSSEPPLAPPPAVAKAEPAQDDAAQALLVNPEPGEARPTEPEVATAVAAPAPAVARSTPKPASTKSARKGETAPSVVSASSPAEPAPATPVAPPESPAPTPGRVQVTGDVSTAKLKGEDGHSIAIPSQPVPPGTYTILATFDGRPEMVVGKVKVAAGEQVVLDCSRSFTSCDRR